MSVGVVDGVSVTVALGVKIGEIVSVRVTLLMGKVGVTGEEIVVLSVDCLQPANIATQSSTLNHREFFCNFISSSESCFLGITS